MIGLIKFFLKKHGGKVIGAEFISTNIRKVSIKVKEEIQFRPGQYIILQAGGWVPRNYSIATSKSPSKIIDIIVNVGTPGVGVRTVKSLNINDKVEFYGPTGEFSYKKSPYKKSWFIAIGSGVAPFIPMIEQAKMLGDEAKLYFGAKSREHIPDLSHLNIPINYSITYPHKDWEGEVGRIQGILNRDIEKSKDEINRRHYYICGNPQIVEDIEKELIRIGVNKKNIIYEEYGF